MKYESMTRADWVASTSMMTEKEDSFAKTFIAKADVMGMWSLARGVERDNRFVAGIIVRVSKRTPYTANLQLLHTFSDYRRLGLAKFLVESEFSPVSVGCEYFRVSAEEDAVPFYQSLGFKFWGAQKSGSWLSIFKIGGPSIRDGIYDRDDPIINRALYSKARGGIVQHFDELK